NRAQVALERLEDDFVNFSLRHSEKTLGGGVQRLLIAANFHVRDRLHSDRHALDRVGPLDFQRYGENVQRQVIDFFKQRDAQRRASAHHAIPYEPSIGQFAFAPAKDSDHVGRDLEVVAGKQRHSDKQRQQNKQNDQRKRKPRNIFKHRTP